MGNEKAGATKYPGAVEKVLYLLFAATQGGAMRTRVIEAIREAPRNANQLREHLGVDYRTVTHHLKILEKDNMVVGVGERYGRVYFLSQVLEEYYPAFVKVAVAKREAKGEG